MAKDKPITISMYPKASMITIYSLGVFLGLLHIFFGLVALLPSISQDYHRELKMNFNSFTRILPFMNEIIDRILLANIMRCSMAVFQLIFGALLLENGHFGKLSQLGNYGLICVDLNWMFILVSIGTPLERLAPTIVFMVLLSARLMILQQGSKTILAGSKAKSSSKPKTSTPKKNKNE